MSQDQKRSQTHESAERAERFDSDERRELFSRLLIKDQRRLYAFILSLVPSWNDADEIAQETNLWLWKEFDRFEPGTNFAAWAMRVAHFHVLTWRKKAVRSKLVFSQKFVDLIAEEQVHRGWETDSHHRALGTCIQELSIPNRDLLAHCYAEEASIREIAEKLNRTTDSVYKKLQRIRLALHKCINRHLAIEGTT